METLPSNADQAANPKCHTTTCESYLSNFHYRYCSFPICLSPLTCEEAMAVTNAFLTSSFEV